MTRPANDESPSGKPAAPTVERLTYRLDDVAAALGISRRAIERERSAGRFPKPDRKIGRMPLWSVETIRRVDCGGNAMTRRDAWVIGCLLSNQPVNGELSTVSPRFRGIADTLADAEPDRRSGLWAAFQTDQPDRDAWQRMILDTRPDEPAPELEPTEGEPDDGWGPLRLIEQPPVEPFPIEVLPAPAARIVREGSEAIGCPLDYLGMIVLAIAAGVIGRSVSLLLKGGYFATASIWGAIVALPSRGKTPALKYVASALRRIDSIIKAEYEQAMKEWGKLRAETVKAEPKAKPPPKPLLRRIEVDDITMESLVIKLSETPRGLIMVRDELSALVSGMDQYKSGKGNDKSIALKVWSGDAILRDRVLNQDGLPIRCPHPCLSIVGGLTPDMLGSLLDAKGRKDGFIDRFLVCYPDPNPVASWNKRGVDDQTLDDWSSLLANVWKRPMNVVEGELRPQVARFTPEADASWTAHYDRHAAEMNAEGFPPDLESVWGKLGEYAGRLALVLAYLWHADNPDLDPAAVPCVDERIVDAAWKLVAYFKSHARRVHASIARGSGIGGSATVKAIVEWIRNGKRTSFAVSKLKNDRRWIDDDDLDEALAYIVERNGIRGVEKPPAKSRGGRPPSANYLVHPDLLVTNNPKNPNN